MNEKGKVTRNGNLVLPFQPHTKKKVVLFFPLRPAHMLVMGFDGLIGPPDSQRTSKGQRSCLSTWPGLVSPPRYRFNFSGLATCD